MPSARLTVVVGGWCLGDSRDSEMAEVSTDSSQRTPNTATEGIVPQEISQENRASRKSATRKENTEGFS